MLGIAPRHACLGLSPYNVTGVCQPHVPTEKSGLPGASDKEKWCLMLPETLNSLGARGRAPGETTMRKATVLLCAWILWAHHLGGPVNTGGLGTAYQGPSYRVVDAYETSAQCTRAAPGDPADAGLR